MNLALLRIPNEQRERDGEADQMQDAGGWMPVKNRFITRILHPG